MDKDQIIADQQAIIEAQQAEIKHLEIEVWKAQKILSGGSSVLDDAGKERRELLDRIEELEQEVENRRFDLEKPDLPTMMVPQRMQAFLPVETLNSLSIYP